MSQKETMVATMVKTPVISHPTSCAAKFESNQSYVRTDMITHTLKYDMSV